MKPWYQSPFQGILKPCKHPKFKNGSTTHLAPKRRSGYWQTSTQMGSLACCIIDKESTTLNLCASLDLFFLHLQHQMVQGISLWNAVCVRMNDHPHHFGHLLVSLWFPTVLNYLLLLLYKWRLLG